MQTWLHFIGKRYYSTRGKFAREAEKFGVTRRISLATLKRMAFGDRIVLAHFDGKTPVVFGAFIATTISGLTPEGMKVMAESFELVERPSDPLVGTGIERGCGSYGVSMVYAVKNCTIEQIASKLEEAKANGVDIGKPMIGGEFIPDEEVRLMSVNRFAQGFRLFDYPDYAEDVQIQKSERATYGGRGMLKLRGHYYAEADDFQPRSVDAVVHEVAGYEKKR